MEKSVIFLVEAEAEALRSIRHELEKRYAADYEVICEQSPVEALARLGALQQSGRQVAVLLADVWMPEMNGDEFIIQAHKWFPQARRGLLANWGDSTWADSMFSAMTLNQIDSFSAKPAPDGHPNEEFHHFLSEFLVEWSREHRPQFEVFRVVGEQWAKRSYELRDLLARNSIPYRFFDVETEEGRALLKEAHTMDAPLPVVLCFNGQVLSNPTNSEVAQVVGATTTYSPAMLQGRDAADVLIVGAGPAGLSAAVNAASEGLLTIMVEREALGGQAGMSSRIRNYLGFHNGISGSELADRAWSQAKIFGAETIFTQEVTGLQARGDLRLATLTDGSEIPARTVILAMGVSYRRLELPNLERLVGSGVFYGAVGSEVTALRGKEIFIVGGANSAGQAAMHLARYARRVTMVVRNSSLSLNMSEYLIDEIEARDNIRVLYQTNVVDGQGEGRLEELTLQNKDSGETETFPADALFVMIGATPHTSWLPPDIQRDRAGFILTGENLSQDGALPQGWPLKRLPYVLETSIPGVFAVGDVRHRSVKRVASAVGEGSMGVQYVHQYLADEEQRKTAERS